MAETFTTQDLLEEINANLHKYREQGQGVTVQEFVDDHYKRHGNHLSPRTARNHLERLVNEQGWISELMTDQNGRLKRVWFKP